MMRLGENQPLTKSCRCLACDEPLDIVAEVETPGTVPPLFVAVVTMCAFCGHLMAFAGDELRDLTKAEKLQVEDDARVATIKNARKTLLS